MGRPEMRASGNRPRATRRRGARRRRLPRCPGGRPGRSNQSRGYCGNLRRPLKAGRGIQTVKTCGGWGDRPRPRCSLRGQRRQTDHQDAISPCRRSCRPRHPHRWPPVRLRVRAQRRLRLRPSPSRSGSGGGRPRQCVAPARLWLRSSRPSTTAASDGVNQTCMRCAPLILLRHPRSLGGEALGCRARRPSCVGTPQLFGSIFASHAGNAD